MSMDITAVRAINAAIRPNGSTFAAITHIRDNDTFSRPPTDLRGSSCGISSFWDKHTVPWGYDAKSIYAFANGSSKYPLAGGAWQIWQTDKTNRTAFLLYADLRCAWFYYK